MKFSRLAYAVVLLGALAPISTKAFAQSTTSRLALVIGEAQYRDGPLATAANDGGLMADLLRQAGYDVTGAANLSQDQIRSSFREFLEKASAAGPQAEIFVYLSGKGVQFAGENYLAPIEATIANSASVPAEAVRLADFIGPLEGMPARARVVVLDIARPSNFGRTGQPLASGLAIVDAPENTLVAFNAAPGTIAPDDKGSYGAYAQSLVEMLRQPGLPLNDTFAQVRLRVNEATRGGQTPWNVTKLSASMTMFAPAPGAPAIAPIARTRRPMREVSPQEAYGYAVEADTFGAYTDFLQAYPSDPLARRVRAMLAARREAITWRRTYVANTPESYWTYLQRYPRGPHSADAGRRLAFLSAPLAPPPRFRVYDDYDVPPPPEDEIVIVDRPRFYMNEVVDVPPPRFADDFLPPVPREYRDLPPPAPAPRQGFLPIPIPIPIPFSRPQGPQGVVTAPGFFQPAPAQGGAGAPTQVPQGYSPQPPRGNGPGRPGAPGIQPGGNADGQLPRPAGSPGAPPTIQPGGNPTGAPPSQALPRPAGPAGAGAPSTLQPGGNPAGAPPSQALPRPAGPAGAGGPSTLQPGGSPTGASPSRTPPRPAGTGAEPPTSPAGGTTTGAPPPKSLPRPEGPAGTPPTGRPGTNSDSVLPRPGGLSVPGAPRSGASPGEAAPVRPAPQSDTPRPAAPSGATAPQRPAPAVTPVEPPHAQPAAPHAAPPAPRVIPQAPAEPRAAPVAPRPVAPAPAAPHVEAPRAAPPPHIEAPRPAAAPAIAPRPVAPPAAPPPAAVAPRPAAPPAVAPHPPGVPHAPGAPGAAGAPHEGGAAR